MPYKYMPQRLDRFTVGLHTSAQPTRLLQQSSSQAGWDIELHFPGEDAGAQPNDGPRGFRAAFTAR